MSAEKSVTEANELSRFLDKRRRSVEYSSNSLIGSRMQQSQDLLSTNPERYHHLKNKAGNGTHFLPYVDYRLHLQRVSKVKNTVNTNMSDQARRSLSQLSSHNERQLEAS